jgi:hypothetical protein
MVARPHSDVLVALIPVFVATCLPHPGASACVDSQLAGLAGLGVVALVGGGVALWYSIQQSQQASLTLSWHSYCLWQQMQQLAAGTSCAGRPVALSAYVAQCFFA